MSQPTEPDDVAQGDPSERDFVDHLVDAIGALAAMGRPATNRDRSRLRAELKLPRPVFSYLGRKGLLREAVGPDEPRVLVQEVENLAGDPPALLAFLWERVGTGRGGRRQPGVYIGAIHEAMQAWATIEGLVVEHDRPHIMASRWDWKTSLWSHLRDEAEGWIAPGDRHMWLHHLRSSQNFALNLFGPLKLRMPWAADVWEDHFPRVTQVEFEYPKKGDPLKECRPPDQMTRTRADVRLDAQGDEADTWLVEVKLTEPEFGPCSAGHDPKNLLRQVSCEAPFSSLKALRKNCYLNGLGRRYFEMLAEPDCLIDPEKLAAHGATTCPFRADLYQILRNLLLVQDVRSTEGRRARFCVVAPGRELNPTLYEAGGRAMDLRQFLRSILKDGEQDSLAVIDFSEMVSNATASAHPMARDWASFMRSRYLVPLEAGRRALQTVARNP